ncbi:zinc-binding protein A33-like isoform X1 [Sinocyclocheilus anshuiensis]|uniref:Zinc-binding protein A33-like n=1 Tax=Sinocyclocheilus anshuiensis TaxID=1608454 RepID=A0A671SII4_9TELE|nr:PREDICTED: zinc-binding protein A33-like isoform X1 [Sinocyclocheilus anshuiensis]XP_016330063.1 PREDICTED: zinc-binding protein A33-like isoform X1 [Sinocyclocheilus anshuiensis]
MATNKSKMNLREDLTCAICFELFKDPVMLGCMHHFCRRCIVSYWKTVRGPVSCPQCRQVFPNKCFQTNYLVAGLVEKVRASSTSASVKYLEKQLKDRLESQVSMKEAYVTMIREDKDKMERIKKMGAELQGRVHSDFQALHHFLRVEEDAMLEELSREQEEMLQRLERHLEALQVAIRDVEQNINMLRQTASSTDQSVLVELPELNSKSPLQELNINLNTFRSKHIAPLQYTMWRKMFQHLNPGPAPLIFDEDTAHPSLQLSRNKTQVIESDKMTNYTCDAKRFLQCVNILATEGFQSGRHYWEVDVSNNPKWDLGVALESVNRQVRVKLCPENGYWTLRLRNGSQYSAGTQPWTPLTVMTPPSRIGVFLDFEERKVSFYNADNMALLCSFSSGPRGKAFPFFSTCLSERGLKPQAIRIVHFPFECPSEM